MCDYSITGMVIVFFYFRLPIKFECLLVKIVPFEDIKYFANSLFSTIALHIIFDVCVYYPGQSNSKPLEIVSYIGIGLSLVCLLATIIFFLMFG